MTNSNEAVVWLFLKRKYVLSQRRCLRWFIKLHVDVEYRSNILVALAIRSLLNCIENHSFKKIDFRR